MDIVIITWNGRDDTLRAIESVESERSSVERLAGPVGVTVVDNGSSDGTDEAISGRFPATRLLRFQTNRGFTGGVQLGVSASTADFVILLNNDAVAEPGWLVSLVESLRDAPADVIAVGGRIIDSTGTRVDFYRGIMTFDGHAFQPDFHQSIEEVDPPADGSEMLFACGGNMIVRRRSFLELGGFDDDYFAYLEDVDFGWRAWLSGWRILFSARATVRHRSSATSDRLGNFERGVLFERNALQTAFKNYEDALLRQTTSPILLTLLHRIHHYTVSRNGDTRPLTRAALGDSEGGLSSTAAPGGFRRRLARLIAGPDAVILDDPLTRMQYRAVDWFFRNMETLVRKREEIQARRTRSDEEIFSRFPLHIVPTYPGDESLMSSTLFTLLKPPVETLEKRLDEIIRS